MLVLDALQDIVCIGQRTLRPAQKHQFKRLKVHGPLSHREDQQAIILRGETIRAPSGTVPLCAAGRTIGNTVGAAPILRQPVEGRWCRNRPTRTSVPPCLRSCVHMS